MKITNQQINIIAYTTNCKIKGIFNMTEDSRLTDVLNANKDFLPIMNASITNLKTDETVNVEFLSLNKNNIEVIFEEK